MQKNPIGNRLLPAHVGATRFKTESRRPRAPHQEPRNGTGGLPLPLDSGLLLAVSLLLQHSFLPPLHLQQQQQHSSSKIHAQRK